MSVVNKGNVAPRDVEGTELTISVEGDSGRIVRRGSYAQLEARSNKGAHLFRSMGLSRGDGLAVGVALHREAVLLHVRHKGAEHSVQGVGLLGADRGAAGVKHQARV